MIDEVEKYLLMSKEEKHKFLVTRFFAIRDALKEIENELLNKTLLKEVYKLELSIRVQNAFKINDINYLGDLVIMTEGQLLRTPNFGRLSLNEVKQCLNKHNLHFGMDVIWPPYSMGMPIKLYNDKYIRKDLTDD